VLRRSASAALIAVIIFAVLARRANTPGGGHRTRAVLAASAPAAPARTSRGTARAERGERGGGEPLRVRFAVGALAAALLGVWLLAAPRTPDLAAATYRANVFGQIGFAVWEAHWYGGHALPGYSLLFPPLGSWLGVRLTGALAVLASALLFERIVLDAYGPRARWAAAWFAAAVVADLWIGRISFALGVPFALAAVLALMRGRAVAAALLATVCAAASPVAGALLALAAFSFALARRRPRVFALLGAPPLVLVLVLALLFGEGGFEPYPLRSFLATVVVALVFLWALPRDQRPLRIAASVYLLVCALCVLIHTPMGSNVERYGVLLAGPLLICAWLGVRSADAHAGGRGAMLGRGGVRALIALAVIAVWVAWGPVRETRAVAGSEATSAAYYAPLQRFLAHVPNAPVRVEVPLTRSHWEAALLAPSVPLARGWEKQLEERYDGALLSSHLDAASYRSWLRSQAVGYVALPDAALDASSAREGALIRAGLPYLREVFAGSHWRVYRVLGATPLLSGPGRLSELGLGGFGIDARTAGAFVVRVHYSRYLSLSRGAGCVGEAPGGWTRVALDAAGPARVSARFSLARAFSSAPACTRGSSPASAASPVAGAGAGGAPVHGALRWLVPTSGAPPTIALENRAAGTRAWRLPGAAELLGGASHGAIAGYVSAQAISPGETEKVYVNAPRARSVRVDVYRMGWYGGLGGRAVLASARLSAAHQPPCAHSYSTGLTECDWHPTLAFAIPSALPSGVYVVKLTASTGAQSDAMFVLRAAAAPAVLVQIPTATYEAYNAWGGDSLYPDGRLRVGVTGSTRGVEVSYDRPYESETGAGQFFIREVALVRFLERYGYAVGYTTDASVSADPAQLRGVRAAIDAGHSEYWSRAQAGAFAQARDGGTSLLFLSSDTLAWRIRYAPGGARASERGAPAQTIVAYKESAALDPDQAAATGLYPGGGAALAGSAYDGCITPRLSVPGPPRYVYYPWRPSPALQPRWLFAGTGIGAGTEIDGISGYELDGVTPGNPASARVVGQSAGAACAGSDDPSSFHASAAQSTLYEARSGALVFASGTLGWLYALAPVPEAGEGVPRAPDPRVVGMTRNLLARALARGG
jgi:hypothetical protein